MAWLRAPLARNKVVIVPSLSHLVNQLIDSRHVSSAIRLILAPQRGHDENTEDLLVPLSCWAARCQLINLIRWGRPEVEAEGGFLGSEKKVDDVNS